MRWQLKTLEEVCQVVNGGTPKSKEPTFWGGDVHWVTPKDLGKLETRFINESSRQITQLGLNSSSARLTPPNSVILSTRAPIGHLAITTRAMAVNQGCRIMVSKGMIDSQFLYFNLLGRKKELNDLGSGTTFLELGSRALKAIKIPVPPLEEQARIVEILDEAFAAIDQAKANIERNLANAKELFQSKLNEVFSNPEEDWDVNPLKSICEVINGRAYKKSELLKEGRDLVVRVGNFFTNKNYYYSNLDLPEKNYCENGDLLYAWSASFGPRIWDGERVIFHYHIWKMVPSNVIDKMFLFYFLDWDVEQIKRKHGTGTTMIHVTKRDMESRLVPIPPLEEQVKLAKDLQQIQELIEPLHKVYQTKLQELEELRQAILEQAFEGKLTESAVA